MGCCGGEPENEVRQTSLLRDLDDEATSVRRAGFLALLQGQRLTLPELALRAGIDISCTGLALDRLAAAGLVERDDAGEVSGVAGLSMTPTKHQILLDGRTLFTWCAIDAVGIPAALRANASVLTSCAHCGARIAFDMDQGLPPHSSPLRGWVPSFDCTNVRTDVCPVANIFCSMEHVEHWRTNAGSSVGEVADLDGFAAIGRTAWGEFAIDRETEHV
jgi:alkylmercury lyase